MSKIIREDFKAVMENAFKEWFPKASYNILQELKGGKSGAFIAIVDILPNETDLAASDYLSGHFVLKLDKIKVWDEPEPNEYERHNIAVDQNHSFAELHIPRLLRYYEEDLKTALLYEIAGLTMHNIMTASNLGAVDLKHHCELLVTSLLEDFNSNYKVESHLTAHQTLQNWLGYRLKKDKAESLHNFIETETGNLNVFFLGERVLMNPLSFCNLDIILNDSSHSRFIGLNHGDLHGENLLVDRQKPNSNKFWLIDFAYSFTGPLFYDVAYFEFALFIKHFKGHSPERLLNLLDVLDAEQDHFISTVVPMEDIGILDCVKSLRNAAKQWQQSKELNRNDSYVSQTLLASVAIALNWANKGLSDNERRLALAYGGWAAKKYLVLFHSDEWQKLVTELETRNQNQHSKNFFDEKATSAPLWSKAWEALNRFNEVNNKFVLVTGEINNDADNAAIGFLPWSGVIDLDNKSDKGGVYSLVSPILEKFRSVKQFGLQSQVVNFNKGTAWLMAGGWDSRNEAVPEDLKEWRQLYLPTIHKLFASLRQNINPEVVKVLVLPGPGLTGARLNRILEIIDIELRDLGQIILLGDEPIEDPSLLHERIDIQPNEFIAGVRSIYGVHEDVKTFEIPSLAGSVSIAIERLRNLEEDLDILHSRILSEDYAQINAQDGFWKGNSPTWIDLHVGLDIKRSIHPELVSNLEQLLSENRNGTLKLQHSPGAGGTTTALRALWSLRTKHPSAILRRMSKLTVDRIDELFQLTQRPILLLTDASILPDQSLDELYRELAERNARVVILHVSRTLSSEKGSPFSLLTPMGNEDAKNFYDTFSTQTTDSNKLKQLEKISFSNDSIWEHYRSPFIYGLVTYEREFTTIDRYVKAYLEGASYKVRKAMLYMALISRYSQKGISHALLYRFLGISLDSIITFEEALGKGPAQLIIKHENRVKLMHPLIAEEVLKQLLGSSSLEGWKHSLKDLVIEFIHEIVRLLGNDSDEANSLFDQLFIKRDYWVKRRQHFSDLITSIPSIAGQHQILLLLTEINPLYPHFWNHLGRHHIYEMKHDFRQAELYLEKAVELDPKDSTLHHSLGMVRRFWVEDTLRNLIRESRGSLTSEIMLDAVKDIASNASYSFSKCRELDPLDEHGYITQIQLILYISERLIRFSGSGIVWQDKGGNNSVTQWLRKNLVIAEGLLTNIQQMRTEKLPDKYELASITGLKMIYGDFDDTIKAWTGLLGDGPGQLDLRRAIANAFYAKHDRNWSLLGVSELQQIVDLMDNNLREDQDNEGDMRLWFQAYRRLPEFSYLQALDRLEAWAARSESIDAFYYLYVLHFLLWYGKKERSETAVIDYLEKCKSLSAGKRGHSYEWLAVNPSWCPLVYHRELGGFDAQIGFHKITDKLDWCRGIIETIKGPKAGTIRIGKLTKAFFVPGTKFRASHDINAVVHFYLGFAYDGFRAWEVDFGEAPDKYNTDKNIQNEESNPITEVLSKFRQKLPPVTDLREQVKAIILDELDKTKETGSGVLVSKLGNQLKVNFPGKIPVYSRLGYKSLKQLLTSFEELMIKGEALKERIYRKH